MVQAHWLILKECVAAVGICADRTYGDWKVQQQKLQQQCALHRGKQLSSVPCLTQQDVGGVLLLQAPPPRDHFDGCSAGAPFVDMEQLFSRWLQLLWSKI
jgi:hypothetical protein